MNRLIQQLLLFMISTLPLTIPLKAGYEKDIIPQIKPHPQGEPEKTPNAPAVASLFDCPNNVQSPRNQEQQTVEVAPIALPEQQGNDQPPSEAQLRWYKEFIAQQK